MKTTVKISQVKSLGVAVGLFFVLVASPVLASQGAQNSVADNTTTATTVVVNPNNTNGKAKTNKTTKTTKTTVATKTTGAGAGSTKTVTTNSPAISPAASGSATSTADSGSTVAVDQPGVISMCASTKSSVLRDTANNSCAPGEIKVEWLDTGASPKICVNSNNRQMTLAQDGKCVAKNTSAVVVASNKQVLACVDAITGLLRYEPSGICAADTGPVNWVLKGQGVSKSVDDAVKRGVNQIISLIPAGVGGAGRGGGAGGAAGGAGTSNSAGSSNGAGSTKNVTTNPASNTASNTGSATATSPATSTTGTTGAKVEGGVISMCASTKSSVLRDTANNSCASGEVKVEWLDTGASPKICVNSNSLVMTLAKDGKCVAKNTSAVVVASNKQVLACVDAATGLLRYQASGICAADTGPVNWVLKGQGVTTNVDNSGKKGVNQIISLIPTGAGVGGRAGGAGGTGTSNGAGSTRTVTTSPATNTSSAITTTTTTPTNPITTVSTAITTTTSSTTTTTIASRASGSFAGYLGGTCPDGSGIPWYWGSGGTARAGGCSAAASIAPVSSGSSGSTGGSASAATTVAPVVVPGTPATPTGVAGNLQVTVSVTAGTGGTPASYTVTQSTTTGGTYTTGCTITGASGSCVITGLTNGTTYFFKTTATNSAGTSSLSTASSSVTPATVPDAPTIGTATLVSPTSVTVACTAPTSNGSATIITYTATSSPGGITGTLTSDTCSSAITVTGLTTGTAYTFTVTATNSRGTSVASAASNSVTPVPATAPGAPTIGTAAITGTTSVRVACTTPGSNGGATILSYTATAVGTAITGTLTSATCTNITVTGLTTGTAYTFTVTATNSVGTSVASAASNSVTPATLTCATGGTCILGDTGPGGGKVFYVRASGGTFTSTGSDCDTTCKYMEAWTSDSASLEFVNNITTTSTCYASGSNSATSNCLTNSIYSATEGQSASATAALGIGMGMANTNKIYDRMTTAGGRATTTYAAGVAWAFTNNGTTDWHLPSLTELKQMCKWQRNITWTSDAQVCADLPALNSGVGAGAMGFTRIYYYSSSEQSGRIDQAWSLFMGVSADNAANKGSGFVFRIVRAFS